ncbi:MAG TPA: hypothetical protein VII92_01430 [Anaerolineae bacterium]
MISAIALAYVVALIWDVSPYVRGPDEWRWSRWPIAQWDKLWPLAIALALILLGVWWIDRRALRARKAVQAQRWIAIGVALLVLAAPIVQLLALRADKLNPFETLFDRAVDVAANSYFSASLRFADVNQALRTYPQLMPTLDIHAQVHPPGLPLLYWSTAQVFSSAPNAARPVSQWLRQLECNDINLMLLSDAQLASALVGMGVPLLANLLTVLCVFKLAKDRFGARAGLYAAALWVTVPSALLFPGSWSLVYPCLACLTWLAVDAGLRRRNILWFLSAGVLLSISTFLELGAAALGLFLTLYVLAHYVLEQRNPLHDWRFLAPALIATLAGVFSIWGAYQLAYGVSLGQIIGAMYPIHTGYQFDRVTWIVNHPYEFAVFLGLPIFCLLVVISIRAIRNVRAGQSDALSLSLLIGLIVLAVVDPARDETARTWMLLMPLAVVIVSQLFADTTPRPQRFGWLWGLMVVQTAAMVAVLNVMDVGLYGLPPRDTSAALPSTATAIQEDFSGMAQLIGYDVQRQSDQLIVDWYWRGSGQADHPYVVFNHLLNDQGQLTAQQDDRPQRGQPLMTCWQPGEIYRDQHVIPLGPDVMPGKYTLEMGLYNAQTGVRVPVSNADGSSGDHVAIRPLDVR